MFIAVDAVDASLDTKDAYEVPFPLLSDPDLVAHEAYKVVNQVDDATAERLASKGMNLEAWSKRKHHKIAIPSIFLVDREGVVRFAHAAHDYKTRPKTDDLLEVLAKNVAERK